VKPIIPAVGTYGLSADVVRTIVQDLPEDHPALKIIWDLTRDMSSPEGYAFREKAYQQFNDDGVIEIDDLPTISPSDNGAYVLAWVWVDREEE
jgi:hypothetical protein